MALIISRNDETVKLGREHRFLIDDLDSNQQIAYALTKPLKVGQVYNGKGIFGFVLQEVQTTNDDNLELGIADYYKHFNADGTPIADSEDGNDSETGKKVWL